MSMKRLAVIAAVSNSHYGANNNSSSSSAGNHHNIVDKNRNQTRPNGTNFNGNVNVVLGG